MNGEVFQITLAQFEALANPNAEQQFAAALSAQILVGKYNNEIVAFIGFIPKSFMSDVGYIWSMVTAAGTQHKFVLGKHAKHIIARGLQVYPVLIGHCFTQASAKWLLSLGAVFTSDTEFEIRRV